MFTGYFYFFSSTFPRMDGGRYIPMSMWPKCLKTWSPLTQFWRPRLSQERHGTRNVAKPLREDDGGLPAFTEYSSVRFSALCGGLTLLSMNPYSAWAFWWLKIWFEPLSESGSPQLVSAGHRTPALQHAPDNLAPYVPGGWLLAEFSRCCSFSVPKRSPKPWCPIMSHPLNIKQY